MSGVGFLYSGGLWFLFIVEILPSGWCWTSGLSRFLVREACVSVLVCGNGFPLWSAMECPVMSFAMGLCVRCDFGQPVC